ncbi:hypothetical protein HYY70_05920 [Candidatus Woesearchaeota archaeon]|nr:hypothetical protein [Candidatus Woesearchaeota archaeon]
MHDIIKKDIIAVLTELVDILKVKEESDVAAIKELSNHVIHNASIFQDEDSISVAILIYSLSKLIERKQGDLDYAKALSILNSCISNLKKNQEEPFRKSIKSMFSFIRTIDERLRLYIHEVINQAQIKKGCKLCEHGISVARASEVLGISQWELMHYLGKTTLVDQFSEPVSISKRLKIARSLFS